MLVPGLPISAPGAINEHQRHELALAGLHQGQSLITFIHRAEPAWKQCDSIRVSDKNQFPGEEVFKRNQLLVFFDHRIGALFPRQTDVRAKTLLRSGTLVAGLHYTTARTGDHHESGISYFSAKFDALLILHARGLSSCRSKNRYLPRPGIGSEEFKGIAQLADGRLDHTNIAAVLD